MCLLFEEKGHTRLPQGRGVWFVSGKNKPQIILNLIFCRKLEFNNEDCPSLPIKQIISILCP